MLGNVPIKTAARLMQKSEMFVRMGLRSGECWRKVVMKGWENEQDY